ncbi:hypothetical protein ACP3TJ_07965 [Desulforudis sp. 1088]|uniref:hypothetical protein n=1 Tax=unclassified Candidatus Desulforudis TaxID=2635950 RepID=UPI003475C840
MNIMIIVTTTSRETLVDAFRFGITSLNQGHSVKVHLMGECLHSEEALAALGSENVVDAFCEFAGDLYACKSKAIPIQDALPRGCKPATIHNLVHYCTEWADKVITF